MDLLLQPRLIIFLDMHEGDIGEHGSEELLDGFIVNERFRKDSSVIITHPMGWKGYFRVEQTALFPHRHVSDSSSLEEMTFLGKVDVPRTPALLPGEVLEKVQAIPIHVHELDQNIIVRFDRITSKIDALPGKPRL